MAKMTKLSVLLGSVILLLLSVNTNVSANGILPCADEIEKFCKDVLPGGGRIAECLEQHQDELSESCKIKCESIKNRIKQCEQACANDIENFCKDIQPGNGRILNCLRENKDEISTVCKESIQIFIGGSQKEGKAEE